MAPGHLEDYVHRVGRTGRGGSIGVAYTLITTADADKADDLAKALSQAGQEVPKELEELCTRNRQDSNLSRKESRKNKGFGGKGYKFVASEKSRMQCERQAAKIELGMEKNPEDEMEINEDGTYSGALGHPTADGAAGSAFSDLPQEYVVYNQARKMAEIATKSIVNEQLRTEQIEKLTFFYQTQLLGCSPEQALAAAGGKIPTQTGAAKLTPMQKVQAIAQTIASKKASAPSVPQTPGIIIANSYVNPSTGNVVEELDINDYPEKARLKISQKDALYRIGEMTRTTCQIKGQYISPDHPLYHLQGRRLYVEVIGPTRIEVQRARHEVRMLLESALVKSPSMQGNARPLPGRYTLG